MHHQRSMRPIVVECALWPCHLPLVAGGKLAVTVTVTGTVWPKQSSQFSLVKIQSNMRPEPYQIVNIALQVANAYAKIMRTQSGLSVCQSVSLSLSLSLSHVTCLSVYIVYRVSESAPSKTQASTGHVSFELTLILSFSNPSALDNLAGQGVKDASQSRNRRVECASSLPVTAIFTMAFWWRLFNDHFFIFIFFFFIFRFIRNLNLILILITDPVLGIHCEDCRSVATCVSRSALIWTSKSNKVIVVHSATGRSMPNEAQSDENKKIKNK